MAGEKAFGGDLAGRLSDADGEVKLPRPLVGDLDRVARKALAGAPAERYSSAEQLAEDVQTLAVRRTRDRASAVDRSIGRGGSCAGTGSPRRCWLALILVLAASSVYTYRQREAARKDEVRANTAMGFYADLLGGDTGTSKNATMGEFIYSTARTIDQLPLGAGTAA